MSPEPDRRVSTTRQFGRLLTLCRNKNKPDASGALVVTRPLSPQPGSEVSPQEIANSDPFVFFGATGDLAYKQIFPALQQMIHRDSLNVPIIGVAKSGWTIDQLRTRVRDSLTQHGGIDETVYAKLVQLLQYIDGD
jgi:Glucose-6-phosphate dehydrogenase, NAD binding domain